ncbi:MAG: radical SAM protein [Desulfobacterales bacterium]|nr:radical SAM protein [Desulfobacterales bacterium]
MRELSGILKRARDLSWKYLGREIIFYLPGMFISNNQTGRYPAISITGSQCALSCDHCRSKILEPMIPAVSPEQLLERCLQLEKNGTVGVLISGGCDLNGRLPWDAFIPAVKQIKSRTGLFISIHSGLIDFQTALALKEAGVDQALIDVVGDDQTLKDIYHVDFGVSRIYDSLEALHRAGLAIIPHIVCGLHYGKIKGEKKAAEMISQFRVEQVVVVSLMRIPGTPLWHTNPLDAETVAEIIAETRIKMPQVKISLGCARQRGNTDLEILAIDAGVNRMALPSEEAVAHAKNYNLKIHYQPTCCSVTRRVEEIDDWMFV